MPRSHEPVALGSIESRSVETSAAIVTDVAFPSGSILATHTHDRTIFGVMMNGAFETVVGMRELQCRVETAWTEPRGERHANRIGREGARVLAIQPNPDRNDLFEPLTPLLDGVKLVHTAGLRADALRLAREIREGEPLASLAIDALVLLMMVSAARLEARQHYHGRAPAWLTRSRDALHDSFARPPQIDALAAIAGVSASHLAHSFRKYFLATPGEYVRHVRVRWAMEQLATTDRDISEIALAAGYADQSHLTRELQRTHGVSPRAYRLSARVSRSSN